jgi:hypothetical protein
MLGTRPEGDGISDYFSQKFVVSILDPGNRCVQMIELTAKYF